MASKRRSKFYQNKKQETTEIAVVGDGGLREGIFDWAVLPALLYWRRQIGFTGACSVKRESLTSSREERQYKHHFWRIPRPRACGVAWRYRTQLSSPQPPPSASVLREQQWARLSITLFTEAPMEGSVDSCVRKLLESVPDWLEVYWRAPCALDGRLKWQVFNLRQLLWYDALLLHLFHRSVQASVRRYKAYRIALQLQIAARGLPS
ncbi:hypothetical protein AAG570_010746 [Ranatra chinensis]|uniref:Uncharacterized protein n=1 Tax=Ranatra chinensis TaxID=642074 RepID=A0ABD0ZBS6_9HEMI